MCIIPGRKFRCPIKLSVFYFQHLDASPLHFFYDFEYEMYDHEWRNGVLYERVLKHGYNTGIDIAWHVMEGFFFFEFTRKILCENSIVQNELNDKLLIRMERFMYL